MKVGDYVRTETGQIGKITYFEGDMVRVDCDKFITYKSNHNEIIKISPNIIDLIEENDFINGMRITQIISNKNGVLECMKDSDYEFITTITNNEVESVLTHEQFESMEYKIGE